MLSSCLLESSLLALMIYENTAWKKVDLKKLNLALGALQKSIVIDDKQQKVIDVNSELK